MNTNLVELVVIVDRSGSMESTRVEAENGINHFIEDQKTKPGEARLTMVEFDTIYDFVYNGVPIKECGKYTLVPRGGTALCDAVGRTINEVGARLAATKEEERPAGVLVLIVTDGGENSSQEFKKEDVAKLIKQQQEVYSWQFTFIGSNQDAFKEGQSLGIDAKGIMNFKAGNDANAYRGVSLKMGRMREEYASGAVVDNSFSEQEASLVEGK